MDSFENISPEIEKI